jgi:cytidylate kinase
VRLALAVFGPTAVGKTSVASRLAEALRATRRNCGEEVLRTISAFGSISIAEHHRIDEETRIFVSRAERPIVVDGRFLHKVLTTSHDVKFVRLRCDIDERARRLQRNSIAPSEEDAADARLMTELYGSSSSVPLTIPLWMDIDTTDTTPDLVVDTILAKLAREPA